MRYAIIALLLLVLASIACVNPDPLAHCAVSGIGTSACAEAGLFQPAQVTLSSGD